jgi:hypothetical protein
MKQSATAMTEVIGALHVQELQEASNFVPEQLSAGHAHQPNGWPAPGGVGVVGHEQCVYQMPSYEGGVAYNGGMQVGQPHQSHGTYNGGGVHAPMHNQYANGVYQEPPGRRQEPVDEHHRLSLVNGAMTGSMQRYKGGRERDAMQPAHVQAPLLHNQAGAPQQRHGDQGWDHGRQYSDSVWPPPNGHHNADMRSGAQGMNRRAGEERWGGPPAQQGGRGHRRW